MWGHNNPSQQEHLFDKRVIFPEMNRVESGSVQLGESRGEFFRGDDAFVLGTYLFSLRFGGDSPDWLEKVYRKAVRGLIKSLEKEGEEVYTAPSDSDYITGYMSFGDDWRGVYISRDDCEDYVKVLSDFLEGVDTDEDKLDELENLFTGVNQRVNPDEVVQEVDF